MRSEISVVMAALVLSLPPGGAQAQNAEMERAPLPDGGFVLYETGGNPNGEPVLFIHGAFIAASYYPIMDEPALSDYYLIRYHRRGFGGSSPTEIPGREREAADAIALLDYLGVQKAHVVGHSAGGPIALWLGRNHPDRVQSLILIESPPTYTQTENTMPIERQEALVDEAHSRASDPANADENYSRLVNMLQGWWGEDWATAAPKAIPDVIEQAKVDLPSAWLNLPVTKSAYPDDFFVNLKRPIVYLASEDYPRDIAEKGITDLVTRSMTHFPGMEVRTVMGVPNHAFQMIAPEPAARAIAEWLAENAIH